MGHIKHSLLPLLSVATVAIATASTLAYAEQANRRATVPVEVSLKAGQGTYAAKGQGTCTHAPQASIYNVRSQQWTVRHEEEGRSAQLTLWKPTDGSAEMFTLSVNGKPNISISTVRGGQLSGSGTVKFDPSGKGGTFPVDAKGKAGEPVSGTLKCDAFTAAFAEGGN
ncbi:MAG: hypothetical protein M3541_12115 [Acidobacteriota bacterium]|nr:hypothetical protein [Acidobacteriota bacterium]MDQ3419504.1 hypothetical protein [Acidobacteriota bacterium]